MHFDMADPTFWVMISFFAFIGLIVYYSVPGIIGKALDARADAIRTRTRRRPPSARRGAGAARRLPAQEPRGRDEAKEIIEQAKREAEALTVADAQGADRIGRAAHQVGRGEDRPRRGAGRRRGARLCRRQRHRGRREDPQVARVGDADGRQAGRARHPRSRRQAELSLPSAGTTKFKRPGSRPGRYCGLAIGCAQARPTSAGAWAFWSKPTNTSNSPGRVPSGMSNVTVRTVEK